MMKDLVLWLNDNVKIHASHKIYFEEANIELIPCCNATEFKSCLGKQLQLVKAVILDVVDCNGQSRDYDICSGIAIQHSIPVFRYSADLRALNGYDSDTSFALPGQVDLLLHALRVSIDGKDSHAKEVENLNLSLFQFLETFNDATVTDTMKDSFRSEHFIDVEEKLRRPLPNALRNVLDKMVLRLRDNGLLPEGLFVTTRTVSDKFRWEEVLSYLAGNGVLPRERHTNIIYIDKNGPLLPESRQEPLQSFMRLSYDYTNCGSHVDKYKQNPEMDVYGYQVISHMISCLVLWAKTVTEEYPDCENNRTRCYSFCPSSDKIHEENGNYVAGECIVECDAEENPCSNNPNQYHLVRNEDIETRQTYPFRLVKKNR